uniref:Uncharacterized protein n=1 Tax=Anguilla anguilla TaxID=7936 RepID=A0A0E9X184_ANGAN
MNDLYLGRYKTLHMTSILLGSSWMLLAF